MDIQTYLYKLFPLAKVRHGDRIGIVTAKHIFPQHDANGFVEHTKPLHCQTIVLFPDGEFVSVDYLNKSDELYIAEWQLVE